MINWCNTKYFSEIHGTGRVKMKIKIPSNVYVVRYFQILKNVLIVKKGYN